MVSSNNPMKIVVVGASDHVWPAAAVLARSIPDHFELVLVEDVHAQPTFDGNCIGWGHQFFDLVGLTAERLVRECAATFDLGTAVKGVLGEGSESFIAQSGDLPNLNGIPIFKVLHLAATAQNQAQQLRQFYQPFRFCARAARARKMTTPIEDFSSPLAMLSPLVSFDRSQFAELLRAEALKYRLSLVTGSAEACVLSDGQSELEAIRLGDGSTVFGDMFVDVSGKLSELVGGKQYGRRDCIGPISLFDRIKVQTLNGTQAAISVAPDISFESSGLKLRLPTARSVTEITLTALEGSPPDEIAQSAEFTAWTSDAPWTGNLVRLGRASASLGPVFSSDLRLLCDQIVRLSGLLPARKVMSHEATAFNLVHRQLQAEYVDFMSLLLHLNQRKEPVWAEVRDRPVSEQLSRTLRQFRHRGRYIPYEHQVYDTQNWIDSMVELGLVPSKTEPLLSGVKLQYLLPTLQQINADFERTIARMPDAAEFYRNMASG